MNIPLKIDYRHLQASPAVEAAIREGIARLERYRPDILGCKVTVETAPGQHRKGAPYSVHLMIQTPGHTVCVSHAGGHGHDDFYLALRDALDAARRQLQDLNISARVIRGDMAGDAGTAAAA